MWDSLILRVPPWADGGDPLDESVDLDDGEGSRFRLYASREEDGSTLRDLALEHLHALCPGAAEHTTSTAGRLTVDGVARVVALAERDACWAAAGRHDGVTFVVSVSGDFPPANVTLELPPDREVAAAAAVTEEAARAEAARIEQEEAAAAVVRAADDELRDHRLRADVDAYADHMSRYVRGVLEGIPDATRDDIYVVALQESRDDVAMFRPGLIVGFNTESRVAEMVARGEDPVEARWNSAMWLQNDLGETGGASDPEGAALLDALMERASLVYDPETVDMYEEQEIIGRTQDAFEPLIEPLITGLHAEGTIERIFGRAVPVCVVRIGDDADMDVNGRANPPGLASPDNWLGLR